MASGAWQERVRAVARLTVYDKQASVERTLYFSASRSFAFRPTDTPAHARVRGIIDALPTLRRDIADRGRLTGPSSVSVSNLVLKNLGGLSDAFAHYAIDGWPCEVFVTENPAAVFPSGWLRLFNGTMEQAQLSDDAVTIVVRSAEYLATVPLTTERYGGTNIGADGLDGNADLKDTVKPVRAGLGLNLPLKPVNPRKLIYQAHLGPCEAYRALYVGGGAIGYDPAGPYADETELESDAAEPLQGHYREYRPLSMVRLGSTPSEIPTADVWFGSSPEHRHAAALFREFATEYGGLDLSQLRTADLTLLRQQTRDALSLDFANEATVKDALDVIAESIGGWWGSYADGTLGIRRLLAPSGDPVADWTDRQFQSFEEVRAGDNDKGLPNALVTVKGRPIGLVQTSGLIGAVTTDRRARLAAEYLHVIASDPSVKVAHRMAPDFTQWTRLVCLGAMEREVTRQLALRKVRRRRFDVELGDVPLSIMQTVDLGSVVRVNRPRYGLTNTLCLVVGAEYRVEERVAAFTLWGGNG